MKNYHKGPLVWETNNIAVQAADQTIQRYVLVFEITGVLLILLLVSGKAVSMT
jgi:NADH:ubiquinone oxidoreductase subunit 6 (subunit J)